ncbi:hypothetical protein MKZ38_004341 [Zalerion maritima]|uniref:C3H1-type domain-containing protein n=1 Tax=Zalerion maritima TaxID=339359 RepID=A0AAD5RMJ0_9PEZI|nr:hypothetical protein MKZ38_004341 [Zalerion maritima]
MTSEASPLSCSPSTTSSPSFSSSTSTTLSPQQPAKRRKDSAPTSPGSTMISSKNNPTNLLNNTCESMATTAEDGGGESIRSSKNAGTWLADNSRSNGKTPLPTHYITRPKAHVQTNDGNIALPGPMVPLVPIDQLPDHVEVVGVPRRLKREQTDRLGLLNVGTFAKSEANNPGGRGHFLYDVQVHRGSAADLSPDDGAASSGLGILGGLSSRSVNERLRVLEREIFAASNGGRSRGTLQQQYYYQGRGGATGNPSSATCKSKNVANSGTRPLQPLVSSSPTTPETQSLRQERAHLRLQRERERMERFGTVHPADRMTNNNSNNGIGGQLCQDSYSSSQKPARAAGGGLANSIFAASNSSNNPPSSTRAHHNNRHHLQNQPHSLGPSVPMSRVGPSSPGSPTTSYCRHWCQHGTCKWGSYCRYTHNMPTTSSGLHEVGLAGFPAWWAAAMGIAIGGGMTGLETMGRLGLGGGGRADDVAIDEVVRKRFGAAQHGKISPTESDNLPSIEAVLETRRDGTRRDDYDAYRVEDGNAKFSVDRELGSKFEEVESEKSSSLDSEKGDIVASKRAARQAKRQRAKRRVGNLLPTPIPHSPVDVNRVDAARLRLPASNSEERMKSVIERLERGCVGGPAYFDGEIHGMAANQATNDTTWGRSRPLVEFEGSVPSTNERKSHRRDENVSALKNNREEMKAERKDRTGILVEI